MNFIKTKICVGVEYLKFCKLCMSLDNLNPCKLQNYPG